MRGVKLRTSVMHEGKTSIDRTNKTNKTCKHDSRRHKEAGSEGAYRTDKRKEKVREGDKMDGEM